MILNQLGKIRVAIKDQAFRAFSSDYFQQRATNVQEMKEIIDGIKVIIYYSILTFAASFHGTFVNILFSDGIRRVVIRFG